MDFATAPGRKKKSRARLLQRGAAFLQLPRQRASVRRVHRHQRRGARPRGEPLRGVAHVALRVRELDEPVDDDVGSRNRAPRGLRKTRNAVMFFFRQLLRRQRERAPRCSAEQHERGDVPPRRRR